MRRVAVTKLKASLSKYLVRVKGAEEILITERGKPVAKVVPRRRDSSAFPEHLLEMERAGLIRLGTGRLPEGFWKMPQPKDPKGLAVKALLEEREHGRLGSGLHI